MDTLKTLETQISELRKKHPDMPEDPVAAFNYLQGMNTAHQTQIRTLTEQVQNSSTDSTEVETRLTAEIAEKEKAVETAEAALAEKEKEAEELSTAEREAQGIIETLTQRVEDTEGTIAELTERAEAAEAKAAEAEAKITELEPMAESAISIRKTLKTRGKLAATQVHGDNYNEAEWDGTFDTLPFAELARQVEKLETEAGKKYGGGRKVRDADPANEPEPTDPLAAPPESPVLEDKYYV